MTKKWIKAKQVVPQDNKSWQAQANIVGGPDDAEYEKTFGYEPPYEMRNAEAEKKKKDSAKKTMREKMYGKD